MNFSSFTNVLSFFAYLLVSSTNSLHLNNSSENEVDDERVIGGIDAFDSERPFQVALLVKGRFFCGGSLIGPKIVLTAAHCVFGAGNLAIEIRYNTLVHSSGPTIKVRKAIPHPRYNEKTIENDIAILILKTAFIPNANAKIIQISRSANPKPGSSVTLSGWGQTSVPGSVSENLKVANFTVIDKSVCGENYGFDITDYRICASDPNKSSCFGDSGGPLTQNDVLVGIVSFGSSKCLDQKAPNVYTRVSGYYSWIKFISYLSFLF